MTAYVAVSFTTLQVPWVIGHAGHLHLSLFCHVHSVEPQWLHFCRWSSFISFLGFWYPAQSIS
jgi:hypothetical protein